MEEYRTIGCEKNEDEDDQCEYPCRDELTELMFANLFNNNKLFKSIIEEKRAFDSKLVAKLLEHFTNIIYTTFVMSGKGTNEKNELLAKTICYYCILANKTVSGFCFFPKDSMADMLNEFEDSFKQKFDSITKTWEKPGEMERYFRLASVVISSWPEVTLLKGEAE